MASSTLLSLIYIPLTTPIFIKPYLLPHLGFIVLFLCSSIETINILKTVSSNVDDLAENSYFWELEGEKLQILQKYKVKANDKLTRILLITL